MDPITQGAVGAAFAQTTTDEDRRRLTTITLLGVAGGMAPDLDVFIQSSTDPLLFLEFHRHFTHALAFIPIGAALVCGVLFFWARRVLDLRSAYLACLAGYATHGLLDACTSYGTLLFWPFSTVRIAWNNVSVVDPLFTLPLLACVILAVRRKSKRYTYLGVAWALGYLLLGSAQLHRAEQGALVLAASRGHEPARLTMKPSFGNLLVWKSIYLHEGTYYVDAIRAGLSPQACPGSARPALDPPRHFPWLQEASQQALDLQRFHWFSDGYLVVTDKPGEVTDIRYSMVPNQLDALWGITLQPDKAPHEHVAWWSARRVDEQRWGQLWALMSGSACIQST